MSEVLTIEVSRSESVLFLLSSWIGKPHLVLSACKLATNGLNMVANHNLVSLAGLKSACTKVFARDDLECDFILIGNQSTLILMQYSKTGFETIKEFADIYNGTISDATLTGNRIFACFDSNSAVVTITVPVDDSDAKCIE